MSESAPEKERDCHVVGPLATPNGRIFLCPVCDDDRVTNVDSDTALCTAEWLTGQQLSNKDTSCTCFETSPFADDKDVSDRERRYFYYRTIARLLGAQGCRVRLPQCVTDRIEELHGASKTGFKER